MPKGATRKVALALCEGWWNETGKRVQVLRVEGAGPKTVDTVADIGQNKAAAFWFDAKDANNDGKIEIAVEASPQAADKNTILNGLWIFTQEQKSDSDALLAGKLNSMALARMKAVTPGGPTRNDLILVHVANKSDAARKLQPQLIVDTTLACGFQPEEQCVTINDRETEAAGSFSLPSKIQNHLLRRSSARMPRPPSRAAEGSGMAPTSAMVVPMTKLSKL